MKYARLLTVVALACLCIGCGDRKTKDVDLKSFRIRGQVVAIDARQRRITISHEEIPDYMMAMTMPFKVKDTTLFATVQPGDSIVGTLAVSRTESWIESLNVIGKGVQEGARSDDDIHLRHLFKEGEVLPDESFTNQDGKRVRFSQFRGKVVALTFIYTRCPLPDFCIRMSNFFSKTQKILRSDSSYSNQWQLLSISFDPKHDTPRVLKEEANKYGAEVSSWNFLTGPPDFIEKLADGFDLMVQPDGGLIDHTLRTALLDRQGRLVRVIKGNDWTAEELAAQMKSLMRNNAL